MNSVLGHLFAAARRDFETVGQEPNAGLGLCPSVAGCCAPAPEPLPPSAPVPRFLHRRDRGTVSTKYRGCRETLRPHAACFSGRAPLHLIPAQSIAAQTVNPLLAVHYGLPNRAVRLPLIPETEPTHGLSLSTWPFQLSPAGPLPCQAAGAAPPLRFGPSGDTAAHRAALRPATGAPWRCRGPPGGPPPGVSPSTLRWPASERIISMTSPYLLRPPMPAPSAVVGATVSDLVFSTNPNLLDLIRWIEDHQTRPGALLGRSPARWSLCSIDGDPLPAAPSALPRTAPFERPDRSRRRRG